jgi:hypothetical protein
MRLACLLVIGSSGCYLGARVGPSSQSAWRSSGTEVDVTGGVELTFGGSSIINPLAGRVRMGTGGTVEMAGEGAGTTTLVAGTYDVEASVNLTRDHVTSDENGPESGLLTRMTFGMGIGGGDLTTMTPNGETTFDATVTTMRIGVDAGWHWGGAGEAGFGLLAGVGLRRTAVATAMGDSASVSPYAEVRIEGVLVGELFLALCQAAASR